MNIRKVLYYLLVFILCGACVESKSEYTPISESETIFVDTHTIPDNHFLGDETCKNCHSNQFEAWEGSHHDKAMQLASEASVLGDFNDATFTSQGVTSRFFKKGLDFYVNTEGPDGEYTDYKIEYTFGLTPLQQYIVKFPDGHFQCLRTAWDTKKNQWYDLYPDFKVVHSEWLHWSRGGLNWNTMCADCHSTNVRKNYDLSTHSYNTKFTLMNVSCEACHGPGKAHVDDVNTLGARYKNTGKLQMTLETEPKTLVDQCARCHMRRAQISEQFNFEGSLLDHYFPELISEPIYHPDGQILDEDYVYGSFVQSKMYHNDVTCTDCHDAHSLKLKFEDNRLCLQCHVPETYDTPKHHFHDTGTEGASCINCHMPGKFYMGNDFRRDHSFRIPRPDLSLKFNTPNACVGCHDDKDNAWAAEAFEKLYGAPDSIHFSELLAPGLRGHANGMESLLTLIKDTVYPDIARASGVKGMRNYMNANTVNELLRFLNDESPLVRGATLDVLSELNATDYVSYLLPLLKDNKRAVRVKAFFGLAALSESQIPAAYTEVYKKVKTEFFTALDVTAEFSGGRARKADYYLRKGDILKGIEGYESALKIDNLNNIIRTNLANLYYNNRQFDKAESAFKIIIEQEPTFGPTYYSLGLLLAELERTEDAIEQMNKAQNYMPENLRVYYNLSLLYDKIGQTEKAEQTILKGLKVAPQNENLLYALAYHYSQQGEFKKAKTIAARLIEIAPGNSQYRTFLQQLNAAN